MKKLTTILILTYATIACGQTSEEKKKEDYIQFVFDSNLPDDLHEFYNQEKIKTKYKINRKLNPFYLRGDFNGDKKIDYALAVFEISDMEEFSTTILIYHPTKKSHTVFPLYKTDAWKIYDKEKEVHSGIGETEKIKLKGDAILSIKLGSSSGLIYWDGKEYKWYQQGD